MLQALLDKFRIWLDMFPAWLDMFPALLDIVHALLDMFRAFLYMIQPWFDMFAAWCDMLRASLYMFPPWLNMAKPQLIMFPPGLFIFSDHSGLGHGNYQKWNLLIHQFIWVFQKLEKKIHFNTKKSTQTLNSKRNYEALNIGNFSSLWLYNLTYFFESVFHQHIDKGLEKWKKDAL